MGDWQTDWGRDVLKRVVILLFALANLADLAADASFLRRRRVLGILNCGEAEARAFVIGMVCSEAVEADALETTCDAELLAVRLRALALMLCAMLTQRFALSGAVGPRVGQPSRKVSGPAGRWQAARLAPDTS